MDSGQVNVEFIFCGRSNVGKSTIFFNLFGVKVRKGKRPGTTIKPNFFQYRDFLATDLPGFGYMRGISYKFNEKVKDFIVKYIEENSKRIWAGIVVVDSKAFKEIVERWEKRGYIPIDIEMVDFLRDVGIEVFLCANKMDKVDDQNDVLKYISKKTRLPEKRVIPTIAKNGDVEGLRSALKSFLIENGRSDLLGAFK